MGRNWGSSTSSSPRVGKAGVLLEEDREGVGRAHLGPQPSHPPHPLTSSL